MENENRGWEDNWAQSEDASTEAKESVDVNESAEAPAEAPAPKKRGRKPKSENVIEPAAEDAAEEVSEEESALVNKIDELLENKAIFDVIEDRIAKKSFLFDKRRVHRASPEDRKELYTEKDKVVATGKEKVVMTDAAIRRNEYTVLSQAARSIPKKICWGTVNGYTKLNDELMVTVTQDDLPYQMFMIVIPVSQFFAYDKKDYVNAETGRDYMENELKSRIGSHVCYCIFDVLEGNAFAVASRLSAMEQMSENVFRKKKNDGLPELIPGVITNAEIVSVRQDRVKVFVGGAESIIKSAELSWTALGPLQTEFKVGDVIPVKVMEVDTFEYETYNEKPQKYKLTKVKLSRREALENPAERYLSHFREGQVVSGIIKLYTEKGVFVNIQNKMDCLCRIPAVGRPIPGTPCIVKITDIYQDTSQITGRIIDMQN